MPNIASAFVVQHLHALPGGEEDVKLIGVYASRSDADAAVNRLRSRPGFSERPLIRKDQGDDFSVEEYSIGKDHWAEGYVTE
ncbi:MAG: serine kinase [Planctomycetota bacterium]